ncbi:linear gramicidin synthetase subunit B domain protein [Mycobacterium xenopi 4042]|uniref:Linear gramicidin synthetase subunit B domain protein n=1 Tax=Mycobacterium xenopi 4042 TaxID=1299334 RepID=X8E5H5_MYCXE|nr:linear gramicidin synthetase subunit B domain protein [Mycobacterium xenopi 4042]
MGLLINTVPVRARITGKPRSPSCSSSCSTCTTTHSNISTWRLANSPRHGPSNCSTPFSCTRTIQSTPPPCRCRRAGHHRVHHPRIQPLPLSVVAVPGRELVLRVEFDTEVFDAPGVEALTERLRRVLVAMTADPGGGCRWWMCWTKLSASGLMGGEPGGVDPRRPGGVDSVVFAEQVARSRRRWRSPPSVAR